MNFARVASKAVAAALFGVVLCGNATAGLLGKTLGIEPQFPNIGAVCCGSVNAVVGAGVEAPPGTFPSYNSAAFVDASDLQIIYGQTGGTNYTSATFNGFHFFDALGQIDPIIGVSIDGATNLVGFDASRLTFDANNIFINMQGLNAAAAHQVVIDLRFGTTQVPEPATIALFGAALLGLGLARRRSRR